MRRVAQIMGMPISIDIPGCQEEAVFNKTFKLFEDIDQHFSPYKAGSELSRYNRGEIIENDLSAEMKEIIKACEQAKKDTNGYFDAWYKKDFDPSGYVKGWAIKRAGELIKKKGYKTFCIGAGGDILAASTGKKIWKIGIQDPARPHQILNKLSIKNGAVATSGTYERGEHIVNPITAKPANEFLSLSVTGPDIIKADVLATAAFAMGNRGESYVRSKGYRVFAYK